MKTAKKSYQIAAAFYGRLLLEASGASSTDCVPEPVQRQIAQRVQEETGWTVAQLKKAAPARSEPLPASAPVTYDTDVDDLAMRMANHSRAGGRVSMYPVGPFR